MINLRYLAMYPPSVCRVIARRTTVVGGRRRVFPISSQDLAKKSKLPIERVLWISEQKDWMGVVVAEMVAFLDGCGLLDVPVWRLQWYLSRSAGKSGSLSHLELLPEEDRKMVSRNFNNNLKHWQSDVARFK